MIYKTNNLYYCLLKAEDFQQLCQCEEKLLGFGIPGSIVVSYAAFYLRKNFNIARKVVKEYGTQKRIEGPKIEKKKGYLLWAEDVTDFTDMIPRYRFLPLSIKKGNLNQYLSLDLEENFQKNMDKNTSLIYNLAYIKKRIAKLEGNFILSSSKRSNLYFDIMPALTEYKSLIKICEIFSKLPSGDIIIGPPYGGVSLAVFASLFSRKHVLIPQQSKCFSELSFKRLKTSKTCTIVDEFALTGEILKDIVKGVELMGIRIKSICLVASGNKNLRLKDISIYPLFYTDKKMRLSFNKDIATFVNGMFS